MASSSNDSDLDKSPTRQAKKCRVYVRNAVVSFEEDATHEFKGHRNISVEEIPPWTVIPNSDRQTRRAISRTLNGFLNSGRAATVYIGILDNGVVHGHNITVFIKDHIMASLEDTFSRYNPPVERHRWSVQFIPVVEQNSSKEERCNILTYNPLDAVTMVQRQKEHLLRTPHYCWCHKDQIATFENGVMATDYVVEIHIDAWDPDHPDNKNATGEMRSLPVHEDEQGNVYFRRQGGVQLTRPVELYHMKKQQTMDHYKNLTSSLRKELHDLRQQVIQRDKS